MFVIRTHSLQSFLRKRPRAREASDHSSPRFQAFAVPPLRDPPSTVYFEAPVKAHVRLQPRSPGLLAGVWAVPPPVHGKF